MPDENSPERSTPIKCGPAEQVTCRSCRSLFGVVVSERPTDENGKPIGRVCVPGGLQVYCPYCETPNYVPIVPLP